MGDIPEIALSCWQAVFEAIIEGAAKEFRIADFGFRILGRVVRIQERGVRIADLKESSQ
jgi:hypothetical protein